MIFSFIYFLLTIPFLSFKTNTVTPPAINQAFTLVDSLDTTSSIDSSLLIKN